MPPTVYIFFKLRTRVGEYEYTIPVVTAVDKGQLCEPEWEEAPDTDETEWSVSKFATYYAATYSILKQYI